MSRTRLETQFAQFLEQDLLLPQDSVSFALRHYNGDCALLPIVLWKYGLATLDEISIMFDWLEDMGLSHRDGITI